VCRGKGVERRVPEVAFLEYRLVGRGDLLGRVEAAGAGLVIAQLGEQLAVELLLLLLVRPEPLLDQLELSPDLTQVLERERLHPRDAVQCKASRVVCVVCVVSCVARYLLELLLGLVQVICARQRFAQSKVRLGAVGLVGQDPATGLSRLLVLRLLQLARCGQPASAHVSARRGTTHAVEKARTRKVEVAG
jgi:hypothetical protein